MDFRWISGFHNGFSTIAYEISVVSDPSQYSSLLKHMWAGTVFPSGRRNFLENCVQGDILS